MNDRIVALRVGLVLLAAGLVTGFLVILLGEGRTYLQNRYTIILRFPQAPGVSIDTPVRKDGVLIGRVTQVDLQPEGGVLLTARIDSQRKIFRNEGCRIANSSLLGDSVLEFYTNPASTQPREPLVDGDFVGDGVVQADPIRVISNLEGDVRNAVLSFQTAAENFSNLTIKAQNILGTNDEQLPRILQKTEQALDRFQTTMASIDAVVNDPELTNRIKEGLRELPQTMKDLQGTMATARETLEGFRGMQEGAKRNLDNIERFTKPLGERGDERVGNVNDILQNLETMTSTVAELADRIRYSDGSLAKLIRDDELYERVYSTVGNLEEASRRIIPILDDARTVSSKLATDPRLLGVKGALDRRPSGTGIKGIPTFRESNWLRPEEPELSWPEVE